MALARLAGRNLQQRVSSMSYAAVAHNTTEGTPLAGVQRQRLGNEFARRFLGAAAGEEKSEGGKEVAVSRGRKRSRLFPRWQRRSGGLWRDDDRDFAPSFRELFPSGLGNALMQVSQNINRLFENMDVTPWQLMGRVKEQDDCYKLRYEMPGIAKENIKITADEGVLRIKGEQKTEEEDESEDEFWSSRSYGYYDTSLLLPDDAKVDEIKAELKDGVLSVVIPRTEKAKKDVKEIQVK